MNGDGLATQRKSTTAPRDLLILVVIAAVALVAASFLDTFEWIATWSSRHESWEIDELLTLALILAVGLGIFSFRRWREANDELFERNRAEEALRESEERFRKVFAEGPLGMAIVTPDYRFANVNKRLCEMVGYSDEELTALTFPDITHPEDVDKDVQLAQQVFGGEIPFYKSEKRYITKKGDTIWVNLSASVIRGQDGTPLYGLGMVEDITERKRVEEALRESEERYRELFENANDIVYTHDLTGRLTSINRVAEQVTGYTRDEALKMNIAKVVAPEHLEMAREMTLRKLRGAPSTVWELDIITKDGRRVPVEASTRLIHEDGKPVAVQGILRDLSERKRMEEELREQARRDPLTGVLNRAAIIQELRNLLSNGTDGASHAVAMVDVDDLKATNDTYGHQVGDAVLVAVAHALSKDGAAVGRYGGDEFVAIMPGTDRAAAEGYRRDVRQRLTKARLTDPESGASVPVSVSIGVALYPEEAGTIEDLIRLADSALYASRRQRPAAPNGLGPSRPLGDDRAAHMVGEIVPLLTSPGDLKNKLRLVAHRLSVGAGYDAVDFILFAPEPGVPTVSNTFARLPEELLEAWNREQRSEGSEPHPIRVLLERTQRPIILNDAQQDERLWESQRALLRAAQLRSALAVPMIWQNQVVGTLSVASKRHRAFTPRDAQFLTAVATQVTAIVQMAMLVEELQSASTSLLQAHGDTVMLLAAAAEAHDHTTGCHLRGVRALTEALAREIGYSEEDAHELSLASVLHDIGKIRVPDSILASTGELAGEEWELMKHHTTWGASFLADRPGFELAATVARSHHEYWDGSGYPDGLAGDAIPEAATIAAVADSFDAMTHDRPYRARRSIDEAMREIAACSGSQFSPKVVAALERLYQRGALPVTAPPASVQEAA